MSNPYQQGPQGGHYAEEPQYATYGGPKRRNILGIVGFIFSVTCLLAPLGLLMSLLALFKSPRGFAIAGVLVGAVFSIPHGIVAYSSYQWATMTPGEIAAAHTLTETGTIIIALEREENRTGKNPASLDNLGLSEATLTDFWGTPYRFEPDPSGGSNWTLSSAGPDGVFGTSDDLMDLVDFASDESRQEALAASFDQTIDPDQFDRKTAQDELFESTKELIRVMFGNRGSVPNQGNTGASSNGTSPDPADLPSDTPGDTPAPPADPQTP